MTSKQKCYDLVGADLGVDVDVDLDLGLAKIRTVLSCAGGTMSDHPTPLMLVV